MSGAFWVTILIMLILTVSVIGYVIRYHEKISLMTGMMVAMSLAMIVGITVGTLLGIILSGNLFLSTLIAILIGIVVGILTGISIGILAVLDGMLSGIMGGMMGAMLGDMVILSKAETMFKILFILFVGIILILFYMMIGEINKGYRPKIFRNPLIMAVILVIFFYLYDQMGNVIQIKNQQPENHMHQNSDR